MKVVEDEEVFYLYLKPLLLLSKSDTNDLIRDLEANSHLNQTELKHSAITTGREGSEPGLGV